MTMGRHAARPATSSCVSIAHSCDRIDSMDTLLTGLAIGESPRWHQSRLWFAHWGTQEIMAVDLDGKAQVMGRVPSAGTFSIDWLPDGTLLLVQAAEAKLLRQTPAGTFAVHCDLSPLSDRSWNELTVDGRGNIYLNSLCFRFGQDEFRPGIVALLTPDGTLRQVAEGIAFPNGMVITPDNSTLIVAESFAGQLTGFDIQPDGSLGRRRRGLVHRTSKRQAPVHARPRRRRSTRADRNRVVRLRLHARWGGRQDALHLRGRLARTGHHGR